MTIQPIKRLSSKKQENTKMLAALEVSRVSTEARSTVTLTRAGTFYDSRYGEFEITLAQLHSMVENHANNVTGQDVLLDIEHQRAQNPGSPGKISRLFVDNNRLMAEIQWTDFGAEMVNQRGLVYLSIEYIDDYQSNEAPYPSHGPTLLGAALTTRPVIKGLDPIGRIQLATPDRVAIEPTTSKQLSENWKQKTMWLKILLEKLRKLNLSESIAERLCNEAKKLAEQRGENADTDAISAAFLESGRQLSEMSPAENQPINLSVNVGDTESVASAVAAELAKRDEETKRKEKALSEKREVFSDVVEKSEKLSDKQKKELSEGVRDIITAEMGDDSIKMLANREVERAEHQSESDSVNRQLSELGWSGNVAGSVRVEPGDVSDIRKLSQQVGEALRKTSEYSSANNKLPDEEKLPTYAKKVLSEFDFKHAGRLQNECRILSGEVTSNGMDVPSVVQRQLLVESFHDLAALQLANTDVDLTPAETHRIQYEVRGKVNYHNDGIVSEGGGVPNSGITHHGEDAQINAVKLGFEISNEAAFLSRAPTVNWDAMSRGIASNSRAIQEILSRSVANEWVRSSDDFGSVPIVNESLGNQFAQPRTRIKTVHFPVVRPKQVQRLNGDAVGDVANPIAVVINDTPVTPWDGSGRQESNKIYWTIENLNMGYLSLVDYQGSPVQVQHEDGKVSSVAYSYATNVRVFNTDLPNGIDKRKHLNDLLHLVQVSKSRLGTDHFIEPNLAFMSSSAQADVSFASDFIPLTHKAGSALNPTSGDVRSIEGLPVFSTNAPALDLGDQRILISRRGNIFFKFARMLEYTNFTEKRNEHGELVDMKQSLGRVYRSIHVPKPWQGYSTSVLMYSEAARTAA